jgi:hypothetical protein
VLSRWLDDFGRAGKKIVSQQTRQVHQLKSHWLLPALRLLYMQGTYDLAAVIWPAVNSLNKYDERITAFRTRQFYFRHMA